MKRIIILSGIGIILITSVVLILRSARTDKTAGLSATTPARETLEIRIRSTGTVQSQNRLEVKPPTSGRLEDLVAKEGDVVRKGQILAWMSSSERVSLLDAARSGGKSEVERWKGIYRPTPVVSPMAGTLILSNVKPGQTVMNSDVLFVISDRLIVQAVVDETDIAKIQINQPVQIVLDAYPGNAVEGAVSRIAFDARTVNNVTTYQVDVLPTDIPAFMKSGMTANVSFLVERKENVLTLPIEAIANESEGAFVYVVGERPGKPPVRKRVTLGLNDGKRIEITDGVASTEKVLVEQFALAPETAGATNPFMPAFGKKPKKGGPGGPL